ATARRAAPASPLSPAQAIAGPQPRGGRRKLLPLTYLSRPGVVGVGVVAAGAHLEEVFAVPGDRVGQVDDVENLGAAEAGDLHGSHAVTLGAAALDVRRVTSSPGRRERFASPVWRRGRPGGSSASRAGTPRDSLGPVPMRAGPSRVSGAIRSRSTECGYWSQGQRVSSAGGWCPRWSVRVTTSLP